MLQRNRSVTQLRYEFPNGRTTRGALVDDLDAALRVRDPFQWVMHQVDLDDVDSSIANYIANHTD